MPVGRWIFHPKTRSSVIVANTAWRLPTKNKNVQKQASLLSQSLYDISVDCANETDPFRQSVRYQQFSRQVEKLGLYGSFREEYIRFLRIAYGSLEYGRTDGLSGISYTDAELREMYGFNESPGRVSEKILYQQGYDMGRAERETWGMVAVISIMKELQAIDPKESPELSEAPVQTEIIKGHAQPPKQGIPNTIYEQLNPDGTVRSRAFYDERGDWFCRQDFDHEHFIKKYQEYVQPHEHNRILNEMKHRIKKWDDYLPEGYDNQQSY